MVDRGMFSLFQPWREAQAASESVVSIVTVGRRRMVRYGWSIGRKRRYD